MTYHVCSSHTFNDLPCLLRLWFILCFSPHISKIYDASAECDLSRTLLRSPIVWPVLLFVLRMDCPMIRLFTGFCVTFILVLLFCMSGVYPYMNISLNLGTLCLYHSLTILLLKLSRIKPAFCFIARCTGYNVMLLKFVSDLRQVSGFLRVLYFPPPIKLAATT